MTKKLIAMLLALTLCVGLLAGCAQKETPEPAQEPEATEQAVTQPQAEAPAEKPAADEAEEVKPAPADTAAVELPHNPDFVVENGAVTFTDKLDRQVTIPQNPERVVILDYDLLDLWYHAGGTAVGRTDHVLIEGRADEDDMGAAIRDVPVMNEAHDPVNMEMIVAQEPDLIIISPTSKTHLEAVAAIEQNNIPYFAWSYDTFEGFLENLELFTLLNDRPDLYTQYATDNITRVNAVREAIADADPVKMVMLLPHSTNGIYALASSGYLGNLCNDMKLENIAGVDASTVISIESLIDIDPDWILSRGGSGDGTEETALSIYEAYPLWNELTAVKEGHFKHLPSELFLYHANTRYADAYEYLGHLIYPQCFD